MYFFASNRPLQAFEEDTNAPKQTLLVLLSRWPSTLPCGQALRHNLPATGHEAGPDLLALAARVKIRSQLMTGRRNEGPRYLKERKNNCYCTRGLPQYSTARFTTVQCQGAPTPHQRVTTILTAASGGELELDGVMAKMADPAGAAGDQVKELGECGRACLHWPCRPRR